MNLKGELLTGGISGIFSKTYPGPYPNASSWSNSAISRRVYTLQS